ncbi:uncharacterized protein LOC113788784 [Dermatophagoides pteronyssinus]|uniref:uncharacterized protein LOC113788784 n=1 Tax=Dermatophagoides pteronyssinus TaxID=6956 RepID=UPI003F67AC09
MMQQRLQQNYLLLMLIIMNLIIVNNVNGMKFKNLYKNYETFHDTLVRRQKTYEQQQQQQPSYVPDIISNDQTQRIPLRRNRKYRSKHRQRTTPYTIRKLTFLASFVLIIDFTRKITMFKNRKSMLIWMLIISILVIHNNNNVDCGRSLPLGSPRKTIKLRSLQQQQPIGNDGKIFEEKLQTLLNAQKIIQESLEISQHEVDEQKQMLEKINDGIRTLKSRLKKSSSSSSGKKIHERKLSDKSTNSTNGKKLLHRVKISMKGKRSKNFQLEDAINQMPEK